MAGERIRSNFCLPGEFLSSLEEDDNRPLSSGYGRGVYNPGHFFQQHRHQSAVPVRTDVYNYHAPLSSTPLMPAFHFQMQPPFNASTSQPRRDNYEATTINGSHEPNPYRIDNEAEGRQTQNMNNSFGGKEQDEDSEEREESTADSTEAAFTDGMIRFLLDVYKQNYDKLSKARNNKDKGKWWQKLTDTFNKEFDTSFTKERLRTKVHNLKSKLKRAEDQNNVSGAGRTNIKLRENLMEAFGDSPIIEGPKNVSVAGVREVNANLDQAEAQGTLTPSPSPTSRKRTYRSAADKVFEILERSQEHAEERENEREKRRKEMQEEKENKGQELEEARKKDNEEKEQTKERRHNERMALAQGILSALNRVADKL